jgi:hypothetical protein
MKNELIFAKNTIIIQCNFSFQNLISSNQALVKLHLNDKTYSLTSIKSQRISTNHFKEEFEIYSKLIALLHLV